MTWRVVILFAQVPIDDAPAPTREVSILQLVPDGLARKHGARGVKDPTPYVFDGVAWYGYPKLSTYAFSTQRQARAFRRELRYLLADHIEAASLRRGD